MGKIFVNYRRDDTRDAAARVRDRLSQTFGDTNIFMDVDNLTAGQRFDRELEKALDQTDVFLAVIGQRWIELLAQRLASGERDYVREEIAGALQRGIVIIPVLIEQTPLPRADTLPEDIRDLVLHQKHVVTHEQFGRDLAGLAEAIRAGSKSLRKQTAGGARPVVRWAWLGASAAGALAIAWVAANYRPRPPDTVNPPTARETAAEMWRAEKERVTELAAQAKREQEARARAEADAKRQAHLAAQAERDLAARKKAEDDRKRQDERKAEDARKAEAAKAEEARRAEEARKAEEAPKLARGYEIGALWQTGRFAGLAVLLDYGRNPADQQAGRELARLVRERGGNVVLPAAPADIIVRQDVTIRRSEEIGKRKADVTIGLECFVTITNAPCADANYVFRGTGEGPDFEIAIERALGEAIRALERRLRGALSVNKP